MGWAGDVAKERAALMRAQRRMVKVKTAALEGELVPRAQVREVWGRLVGNLKARCLSIPSKLAGRLLGLDDPNIIRERIEEEILAALAELSSDGNIERVSAELRELSRPGRGDATARDSSPATVRKRVGRRKPPAK